jgi:hypothetical protein
MIQSTEIGKSRKSFAPSEEGQKIHDKWESVAYRWLAPYVETEIMDSNNNVAAFAARNSRFYIGTL